MTARSSPTRSRLALWIFVSLLLVIIGSYFGLRLQRNKTAKTPVAAYLLPVDDASRVKISWHFAKKIDRPLTLHSGETAAIPAGAKVVLLHADTGATETITGPAKIVLQQKLPDETDAFASPLAELIASVKTPTPPPDTDVLFTSPVGVTRYLNPQISWTAQPGKTYDVAVLDPADPYIPPRVAEKVYPPIALSELKTPQSRQLAFDRNYEIIVRETGSEFVAGHARFLTAPNAQLENQVPATPVDLMAEACTAMVKKPYRTGDAWLALSRLPAEWVQSELGVRLRLRIGAELFSMPQVESARADANRILQPR